jgi:hypothetical protein
MKSKKGSFGDSPSFLKATQDILPKLTHIQQKTLFMVGNDVVRLVGLEPTTYGFEIRNSIQLSYRRIYIFKRIYVSIAYRFLSDCPVQRDMLK